MKSSKLYLATIGLMGSFIYAAASIYAAEPSTKLEDSLTFSMSGGPAQDAINQCVAAGFTKKFNVRVNFESAQAPQALAKIIAQRNSPTLDVFLSISAADVTGAKEGLFVPLNPSLVPNLANVDPKFATDGGGAPVSLALQGMAYRTDIFKEKGWDPPKSYKDLSDPKYKGHVGIYGLGAGGGQNLLAVGGFLYGGNAENFDAAFDFLAKIKPNLYTIFDQAAQFDAAYLNGNVWIGYGNAGRPFSMMQQGAPVAFIQPEEGLVVPTLTLQVIKGAPHPNASFAFVNWMLSKEGQGCLPAVGYPPVIKDMEIAPNLAPYLVVQRKVIPVNWAEFQDKLPELLLRWNKDIGG